MAGLNRGLEKPWPALVVAWRDLDETLRDAQLGSLVTCVPKWEGVSGVFRPTWIAFRAAFGRTCANRGEGSLVRP